MWFKLLKGDAGLGRCATEDCGGKPTWRLEADGTGSNYCSGCRVKIENERTIRKPSDAASRDQWREVTKEDVKNIEELVAPEFATGTWQTVESESDD